MKNLKDLIIEAKLNIKRDPFDTVAEAFAQCVTHYDGHGSAGKYTAAPAGKSGLDGDCLDKVLDALKKSCQTDANKMSQDEIANEINESGMVLIHTYVYDKRQNNGKGFIGFSIYGKRWEMNLTEGYVNIDTKRSPSQNKYLSGHNSYLYDEYDFLDILSEVKWPDEAHFTNVTKFDEFKEKLSKIIDLIEG